MNINQVLGKRLRNARRAERMTQVELADALNVNFQTVGNYERAVSPITVPVFIKACAVLNRQPAKMLEGL